MFPFTVAYIKLFVIMYHLVDVETGKVVEFADPELERVLMAIAERLGFELVSHRLQLFARRAAVAPIASKRQSARASGALRTVG